MKKERKLLRVADLQLNEGQLGWLPKNPRQWTQGDIDKTAASIREDEDFLEERPILVIPIPNTGDFVVFCGNLRREGAKAAGVTQVPCVIYIPETEDDREAVLRRSLKDNGSFGRFDWDEMANSPVWGKFDLASFGIPSWPQPEGGDDEQPGVGGAGGGEAHEDDFDEEKNEVKTRCKSGDIWQLGEHRLMCGDSTDADCVAKLMKGEKAELTFTDPPYRLETTGGGILKTANSMKQIRENKVDSFDPLKLKIYSPTNIYTHNKPLIKYYILLAEREGLPYDLAIYKKQGLPNYKGHLMTDIEYIAIIGNQDPRKGYELEMYSKVFSGGKDRDNELSYSKPIRLCEKFICLYSDKNDIVLDLFGGSGSTLIAAEQLGRKCYMMELDPHYCDVIIARWEKLTGNTATKLN